MLEQVFGSGAAAHIALIALSAGCTLLMLLCGKATLVYKMANVVQLLLEAGSTASSLAPASTATTSSSALSVGAKAAPAPIPVGGAQVIQGPPEQDQQGLP